MATGSKHQRRRNGIINADLGGINVAFGPHHSDATPVIQLQTIVPTSGKPHALAVALDLDEARELRGILNAVIGLMAADLEERSS